MASQAACVRHLEPPEAPERDVPAVPHDPDVDRGGLARVYVTSDVPARVVSTASVEGTVRAPLAVVASKANLTASQLLCAETPCVVTLPYGDHELAFVGTKDPERVASTLVRVRHPTEVVNQALGRDAGNGDIVFAVLGGLGVVSLVTALAVLAPDDDGRRASARDREVAGWLALGGLGSITLGGLVWAVSPSIRQEGSTNQWSPHGRDPSAKGSSHRGAPIVSGANVSVGVRF